MIVLTLARKPLIGSVATNVLKHGTGGINVDGTRLFCGTKHMRGAVGGRGGGMVQGSDARTGAALGMFAPESGFIATDHPGGRWPANLILCHLPGCLHQGTTRVKANQSSAVGSGKGHENTACRGIYFGKGGVVRQGTADADGMGTVEKWECTPECPVRDLDQQSGSSGSETGMARKARAGAQPFAVAKGWNQHSMTREGQTAPESYGDAGGASRFFKQVGGQE